MRLVGIILLVVLGVGILVGLLTMPVWIPEVQASRETKKRKKIERFGKALPGDCFLLISGVKDFDNDVLCYYVDRVSGVYTDHVDLVACAANINNPNIDVDKLDLTSIRIYGEWITDNHIKIKWFDRTSLIQYLNSNKR